MSNVEGSVTSDLVSKSGTTSNVSPAPAAGWRGHWRRDVLSATVVVLFTVAMHWFAEDSRFGVRLKDLEYRILQGALWSSAPREQDAHNDTWLPPVVIDSSQMRRDKTQPTDREKLDELVTRLDELGAPAIGIDVDFSPTVSGDYLTTEDARLLAKWNDTKKVKVGVYRRQVFPAERWLGYPQFRGMAAGMMLPRDMPDFAYLSISTHPGEYLFELPSALFGHALGEKTLHEVMNNRSMQRLVVGDTIELRRYVINYAYLDRIPVVNYRNPSSLAPVEDDIRRRAVLIGDLSDPNDRHYTHARRDPVPGVLVHASALATMNAGMLWYIDGETTILFDMFVLAIIAGALFVIRVTLPARSGHAHFCALEILLTCSLSLAIVLVSTTFINSTRIFWPDFLWIALGVFVLPYLADVGLVLWSGVRGFVTGAAVTGTSHA